MKKRNVEKGAFELGTERHKFVCGCYGFSYCKKINCPLYTGKSKKNQLSCLVLLNMSDF